MRIDVLTMFRDETFALLNEGYAFVPNRRLTANADMVYLRALGRRIVAASGQRWAEQFCDEQSVQRGSEAESAVPPGPRADEAGRRHRPANRSRQTVLATRSVDAMRIVVTGASGNVGTAVLRQLSADPVVDSVVALARRRVELSSVATCEWRTVDLAVDAIAPLLRGADAVVHLAWLFQPTHHPQSTWANNVGGTARLLDAVASSGVRALVVASSVGAYSPAGSSDLVDESWPTHGWSAAAYSREKAYVERMLDAFEAATKCRVVRMRPGFIFQTASATQQRRLFAGPLLAGALLRPGLLPVLPWPRGLRFQALHADDAARAYSLALKGDARGAFNLAADPVVDHGVMQELLDARAAVAVPGRLARGALSLAWHAHMAPASPHLLDLVLRLPLMSARRAHEQLGWVPRRTATDALRELLAGLRHGAAGDTPPLSKDSSGTLRSREVATGVGSRP